MNEPVIRTATHLSIAWGVALAVMTLVEWNSLEREPMREQILLPFIERTISLSTEGASSDGNPEQPLNYIVSFEFNGPLFLACFFLPVALFQLVQWLLLRRGGER